MAPTLPNLDGLLGLANRKGVDVRPTLVRVLTDLYVQRPTHSDEEERRYTELALWLLGSVDVATRAAVGKKLAGYANAPRAVIERLARDVFDVAEPILMHSPCLTSDELLDITRKCDSRYAAAIAVRFELQARPVDPAAAMTSENIAVTAAPAAAEQPETAIAKIKVATAAPTAPGEAPPHQVSAANAPSIPAAQPARSSTDAADAFFAASPAERRLMLATLEDADPAWPTPLTATPVGDAAKRLERAALGRNLEDYARELQRALRLSPEVAQRIVQDDRGEAIAVAAKALAVSHDVLLRILLVLNPKIGQSVDRVFSLVKLYEELTPQVALRMVSSWRRPGLGEAGAERHKPVLWDDEKPARSARRGGRRGAAQTAPDPAQRPAAGKRAKRRHSTT